MFCFPCRYFDGSPIRKCVESIRKFHPEEPIVIVDSMSEDKSYYDFFADDEKVHILDNCNPNRVPGSFYQTIKHFPNEPHYVSIHDSLILKKSIQKFIDDNSEFTTFAYFHDAAWSEDRYEYEYMRRVFGTAYEPPSPGSPFVSSFGPMFIIKNPLMKRIYDTGAFERMTSNSKVDDQIFERLMGILAEKEGYYPPQHSIVDADAVTNVGLIINDELEYFTKYLLNRA